MITNEPRRRGRPNKDPALVLRDRYWALNLEAMTGDTLASLERKLLPQLRIGRRENGEGHSQPFSLSKVARGTRGLSPYLNIVPDVVRRADRVAPGSMAAFTSILWYALASPTTALKQLATLDGVADAVATRIFERHWDFHAVLKCRILNRLGIRRAARLGHRDALGLLLCHCPPAAEVSHIAVLAELYIFHVLNQCCKHDVALTMLRDQLLELLSDRYTGLRGMPSTPMTGRIFLGPRESHFGVSLRRLFDGDGARSSISR